jgi:hypothetical protein
MTNKFTLDDVVSDRIYDSVTGWRDRLPEERIILNDAQKESFVREFGYKCRQITKNRLESFIQEPRTYRMLLHEWMLDRIYWVGDECRYCGGQDCNVEYNQIRRAICGQ